MNDPSPIVTLAQTMPAHLADGNMYG